MRGTIARLGAGDGAAGHNWVITGAQPVVAVAQRRHPARMRLLPYGKGHLDITGDPVLTRGDRRRPDRVPIDACSQAWGSERAMAMAAWRRNGLIVGTRSGRERDGWSAEADQILQPTDPG